MFSTTWFRVAAFAVVLASCTERDASAPASAGLERYALYDAKPSVDQIQTATRFQAGDSGAARAASPGRDRPDALNLVIRTGQASIRVDSLEPAIALVRGLAARLGGSLANTTLQAGDNQVRTATIELLIPVARFDDAVSGLKPIGKVESVNVTAQDVGEEFVDIGARMENARRLERRLIDLLTTRVGKLADVLEVEQALARCARRSSVMRAGGVTCRPMRRSAHSQSRSTSLFPWSGSPARASWAGRFSRRGGTSCGCWRSAFSHSV